MRLKISANGKSLPVIALYLRCSRFVASGFVMAGAVKG
jgi:hypothetical protein